MSAKLQHLAKWEASSLAWLHRQSMRRAPSTPPRLPDGSRVDLAGQTGLVTGANIGLGLEATRQLLQLGLSRAILAVRSAAKGDSAATQLRSEFPHATVDVWPLDMASYDSIRALARRCGDELHRLDVVILNAGLQASAFVRSAYAHETDLQINYLSTVLLAILLLPVLKAKKKHLQMEAGDLKKPCPRDRPARLTAVSSDTAFYAPLDCRSVAPVLPGFNEPEKFAVFGTYKNSKLLLIMAFAKLAELCDARDVVVNTVNPGLCAGTDLGRRLPEWLLYVKPVLLGLLGRPPSTGASTYLDAALVQGQESHGSYCSEWTIKPFPPVMYTEHGIATQDRLWEETLQELGADRVGDILAGLKR